MQDIFETFSSRAAPDHFQRISNIRQILVLNIRPDTQCTRPGAYATKPPCEAQAKASLNPVSVRGQLPAFTRSPRATHCMRSATRSLPTPHITPAVRWPSDQAARTPRICDARPHLPWDLEPLGLQMARGAYQNPGADRRACGAPWLLNLLVLPRFSGVAWLSAVRDVDVRCAGPIAKLHLNERSVVGGSATRADVRDSRMGWGACSEVAERCKV